MAPRKAAAKKSRSKAKSASRKNSQKKKNAASTRKASKKTTAKKTAGKTAAKTSGTSRKSTKRTATAKKATSRKTSSPFDRKFLESQKKLLLSERETYARQATSLQAEADSLVADVEPGDVQFDEESGEGDTLQVERERDLALSAQAKNAIEEIDHALAKFDDGTYGMCEVSGTPIPKERLKAIPWARERVEYKVGGLSRR